MSSAPPEISTSSPRKLKILMLHGYTQSGPLFHAKTRALEKALQKAFPSFSPSASAPPPGSLPSYPGGIELLYPTGPIRLNPSDIPGAAVAPFDGPEEETDCWAWWRREGEAGQYLGIDKGFEVVAETIKSAGGVDGVIGYSQGGCAAGFVASLLEHDRVHSFDYARSGYTYPSSFGTSEDRINPPLKFAVSYSGFYAPYPAYKVFYEPKLKTPLMSFIGTLDSVVEESRSLALANVCESSTIIYHPGGHFVPVGKDMVGNLIGFIRKNCGEVKVEKKVEKKDESAEDMDVPF